MRLLSQIFQPIIIIPKGAKIKNTEITCKSQKLLLECGLIRPTSAGFFTILPLARRAITKLEDLIHKCLKDVNAQRISLPCLTSSRLWERSGRLEDVGSELFQVEDRHDKRYLLAPTHEEAVADLMADVGPISYKQLPLLIYQITNKYRDELRPKHGLLRSREFQMMDLYGFHTDQKCAENTYNNVNNVYKKLFKILNLPVYRVVAPSGDMGGTLSHEWQLPATAGEDSIAICPSCSHTSLTSGKCSECGKETDVCGSVEVGHTFILGTKYSEPLQAKCITQASNPTPLIMSCYGIGITRLLAASIEALSTDSCIRWPAAIAPFSTIVIGPKEGSKEWSLHGIQATQGVARCIGDVVGDVLLDDRHTLTIGKRMMMADRMGYPNIIVCGRNSIENPPKYELYANNAKTPLLLDMNELMQFLRNDSSNNVVECAN
ncbi:probable proline--tRNA ligase, mitochondrial isoform X1 [Colias croceus]|uniref:probable proline--tRNA ligase, mitochondrial isoform X1 n=1 Tax=Colias crocea TaxID=72248 RepID=UPI001E27C585|nr:probable proline--tRNA ligase, mitochondrial isoform X1 [Colias croceus]